ncbi:hypothetical protein GLAREA_08421 [Glarea lozoyensis ATCC 20868]|uniref:Uncharacterized protein n=1 Tax=Glarea lozoyensis (strain ATCC 20868 / MF5171) TaxID=1116229 RepID=S3CH00_GLAL2|nr:uncharacterized protein GLAREA_08421 [Glarea lozoyensis ATCC 20868]EPE24569.1 hypothetical protein GLAREA_08421 [Glarea lozoyensis ATCC 20868]
MAARLSAGTSVRTGQIYDDIANAKNKQQRRSHWRSKYNSTIGPTPRITGAEVQTAPAEKADHAFACRKSCFYGSTAEPGGLGMGRMFGEALC